MKEGGSSWKIKSKDGKMISMKKEEHAAIYDHMNIQVDKYKVSCQRDGSECALTTKPPVLPLQHLTPPALR